jgi:AcrR family transcriptional regulator
MLNARSRRTREALLASARSILEEQGFDALTMTAVADHAGVTRRAVYLHFPSRAELLGALFDYVASTEGLHDSLARVWAAPDAGSALDEWGRHLARYHVRLLAVDRAISRVEHADPDAAAHRARVSAEKLSGCRRLARRLQDEGVLADAWTVEAAADMVFALSTSDVVGGLVVERRWSPDRLARHLGLLFRSTFLAPRGR